MRLIALLAVLLLPLAIFSQTAPPPKAAVGIQGPPNSVVGLNVAGTAYVVNVNVTYTATAASDIECYVFDENTSTWQYMTVFPGGASSQAVAKGQGVVTFTYTIPLGSSWANQIAADPSGTNEAWVEGAMLVGGNVIVDVYQWIDKS